MAKRRQQTEPLAAFVDGLQAEGRYTFTNAEAEGHGDRSEVALRAALRRLRQRGRIASPRQGFHVIVPLEYRTTGAPPASWFIDELMRNLGQPYYVGLLSAAALHGAAHQQPMVFQVVTDRPTRPMRAGRARIELHVSRLVDAMPTLDVRTETGSMRVSSPEATAFDLVRFPGATGHLGNVATVLSDLVERLDGAELARLAPLVKMPDVQRLGFLLDKIGQGELAAPLAEWLAGQRFRPVPLSTRGPARAEPADSRWRVIPNEDVEVDE